VEVPCDTTTRRAAYKQTVGDVATARRVCTYGPRKWGPERWPVVRARMLPALKR